MSRRPHIRFGLVAFVVTALLLGGSALAVADTDWKTFGSAWSVNRGGGTDGSPDIWMSSVSKKNPVDVRYTIKNHEDKNRTVQVYWDLDCWKKDSNGYNDSVTSKSGDYTATIGAGNTLKKSPTFNSSATWCQLDVWVDYTFANFGDNGKLTMKFQAKY